jgi:hypothetical protein
MSIAARAIEYKFILRKSSINVKLNKKVECYEFRKAKFETKCVHAGIEEDVIWAVVPPIYQTSTFKV